MEQGYKITDLTIEVSLTCRCGMPLYLNDDWPTHTICSCGTRYFLNKNAVKIEADYWDQDKEEWIDLVALGD